MKKLTGIFLAVCMLLSLSALPAAAHQEFSDFIDFEDFETNYDPADETTFSNSSKKLYETEHGYITSWSNQTAKNGIMSEGPEGSKYGKALKVYQGKDTTKYYGGATYYVKEKLYNTVYIEVSLYHEEAFYRSIRLRGSDGSNTVLPLYFDGANNIVCFGKSTGKKYEVGKWYDFKCWYNMKTKEYKVIVDSDGVNILNKTAVDNGKTNLVYIDRVELFNNLPCDNAKMPESTIGYWDNLKVESSYKYMNDKVNTFENYVSTSTLQVPPTHDGDKYLYTVENGVEGTDGILPDNTQGRGTSVKIMSGTKDYPSFNVNCKKEEYIPAAEIRISVKIPEKNPSRAIYMTLGDANNTQIVVVGFDDALRLIAWGTELGKYNLNVWYDLRLTLDARTGAATYSVSGEDGFEAKGNVDMSIVNGLEDKFAADTKIRRIIIRQPSLKDKETGIYTPCHYFIDNLSFTEYTPSFEIDIEKSTTGKDKEVKKDDDVIIKFNNKLAAAETPEALKGKLALNFGKGTIDSVERVDDYTLKVNFEKQSGKHYHVSFDGIIDENGLTLTDYIEFDTLMQDTLLGNVSFLRDGNILTLLTPGEVTASFKAEAHNGVTLGVMHTLALYCDGRLSQVRTETISAHDGESTSELSLTVPDDGKTYVLKSMRWEPLTLMPYGAAAVLKPTTDLPIVLLKLDDFGYGSRLDVFEGVRDWVVENELKAGFGLMGYTLGENNATPGEKARIKAINDNPRIEVWSHGYDWRSGKFKNGTVVNGDTLLDTKDPVTTTTETQRAEFAAVFETSDRYGIDIKAFNPPSNDMDEATVQLLDNEFKRIKTVMLVANSLPSYLEGKHNFTPLYKSLKMEEGGTGCTRAVEDLKASWETAKTNGSEYVMLQSHPYGWKDYDGAEARFKEFVLWLKAQGAMFMTPSEYTAYAAEVK